MSELSKQALKVENTESFPNNSAGLITPSALRTFNEDMIDSLVDEITYNEDSASWNQSIDALEQFTASQQPSFTALNEFTASQLVVNSGVNSFTQSADGRLDTLETEVDSLQAWTGSVNEISDDGIVQGYSTRLHFYGNVSASIVQNVGGPIASINVGSADTGSLLTTASFDEGTRNLTFTKGDASQFSVYIADVSGSVLPSGVVSGSSQIILQDTTGDLSGSRIDGEVANAVSASYAVTASYALNSQTIDTGSFATTGSNTFIGDQTITGSVNVSELVTADIFSNPQTLTGTLTIPTDRNAMVVGTVAIDGSVTIEGDSKLVVIDQLTPPQTIDTGSFATTGSNSFIGNQTVQNDGSDRTGITYNSGSSQIFAGLSQEGRYIISSSANDKAIEINPQSGFVEVYGQINFNSNAAARGPLQVRDVSTDIGFGYVAQFDGISGSSATITGPLTVSQSTEQTNQFIFAQDGAVIYNWPNQGTFYRMQNGAFQFSTATGIGMVFDAAGIDFRNSQGENQRLSLSNSPATFGALNQTPYTGSLRGLFYNQTSDNNSPTLPVIGVNESSSFDNTAYIEMNLNVSGSTTIGQAMSLTPQDPLPSGNIGDLAVSGSSLYFYNGAWTLVV